MFDTLKDQQIKAATHPNVRAWFELTRRFSGAIRNTWPAPPAPKKEGGKAEGKKGKGGDKKKEEKPEEKKAEKDGDDDLDLFGDDDEEEAEAAKKAAAAAKEEATKKKKKVVIEKSLVIFEVKPLDDQVDLDALGERILAEVAKEGLFWKTEYRKDPVAFGIFKLIIGCTIEDAKVSVDNDIVEPIEAMDDMVQSVDIKSFDKL